jgi:hypothetical protein
MKRITTTGLVAALAAGLFGCQLLGPTELQKHWGDAQRENKTAMIAHPEAEELNTALPEGLDPATGEQVMINLRRRGAALERLETKGPSIINIGTGGSR